MEKAAQRELDNISGNSVLGKKDMDDNVAKSNSVSAEDDMAVRLANEEVVAAEAAEKLAVKQLVDLTEMSMPGRMARVSTGAPPIAAAAGAAPVAVGAGAVPVELNAKAVPVAAATGAIPISPAAGAAPIVAGAGAVPVEAGAGAATIVAGASNALMEAAAEQVLIEEKAKAASFLKAAGAAAVATASGAAPVTAGTGAFPLEASAVSVDAGAGAVPVEAGAGAVTIAAGARNALMEAVAEDLRELHNLEAAAAALAPVAVGAGAVSVRAAPDAKVIPIVAGSSSVLMETQPRSALVEAAAEPGVIEADARAGPVVDARSSCSGWAPNAGEGVGTGAWCARWGTDMDWCFAEQNYNGPGMDFLTPSPAYEGKFYVPCTRDDRLGMGNLLEKTASQSIGASAEAEKLDNCLGWAPNFGPWQDKGGSCGRWGWEMEWCYVSKNYAGPGTDFIQPSTAYSDKFTAPCA
jgi:hypothetical protein